MQVVPGTIDFSAYKDFKLHPLKDVAMPVPGPNGMRNLAEFCTYPMRIGNDWRMRAGGVLFALGEYGDFFNCISNYHSGTRRTTGIPEWDSVFEKLHSSEYAKKFIPCMVSALQHQFRRWRLRCTQT